MRIWHRKSVAAVLAASLALGVFLISAIRSASALQAASQQKVVSILILKKDHVMQLLANGKVIRTYKVALGSGGLAPKQKEGDARTPEGHYTIDSRNEASHYHKALHISYPSAADRQRAAKLGVAPGGAIMIHGLPNGLGWAGAAHRMHDWTLGCVAVTDDEIDEIWQMVPIGTPVEIRP